MTQFEMTEMLSEKMDVSQEEAKTALEASDWNMLTATHEMEKEAFRRRQEVDAIASDGAATAVQAAPEENEAEARVEAIEADGYAGRAKVKRGNRGLRNLGEHLRRLVICGNRSRFEVRKGGDLLLNLPVTVLALALVCAFWACVPLLVIGLFAGCRYSIDGSAVGDAALT